MKQLQRLQSEGRQEWSNPESRGQPDKEIKHPWDVVSQCNFEELDLILAEQPAGAALKSLS